MLGFIKVIGNYNKVVQQSVGELYSQYFFHCLKLHWSANKIFTQSPDRNKKQNIVYCISDLILPADSSINASSAKKYVKITCSISTKYLIKFSNRHDLL